MTSGQIRALETPVNAYAAKGCNRENYGFNIQDYVNTSSTPTRNAPTPATWNDNPAGQMTELASTHIPAYNQPVGFAIYGGTLASGTVVIGSQATQNCVSRYGAQDMSGNVAEWMSDELGQLTGDFMAVGTVSRLDPGNDSIAGWGYDDIHAPSNYPGGGPGGGVIDSLLDSVPYFNPILGLQYLTTDPSSISRNYVSRVIPDGPTNPIGDFHQWNGFVTSGLQSPAAGGAWMSSMFYNGAADDSRFAISFNDPLTTGSYNTLGFRCGVPAE